VARAFDIISRDDPAPGFADITRIAGKLRRKMGRARSPAESLARRPP